MEDTRQFFECEQCAVEYSIQTDMEIDPEFCPFCGEPYEILEWTDNENTEQESEGTQITTKVYEASYRGAWY